MISGIVSFYTFFGIVCWMAFGDNVGTVMTTSPGAMATTVKSKYSLAVVFTLPLQHFPSLEIVCVVAERMLPPSGKNDKLDIGRRSSSGDGHGSGIQQNIMSTLLVMLLSVVAVSCMDDLDNVVSLMGSLLSVVHWGFSCRH